MAPNTKFGALFMGNTHNLQDIMNVVAQRLEAAPQAFRPLKSEPLDEMQAFLHIDSLMCSLNKQYLDARENRVKAECDFGHDDGMTEMALLIEDSAWCAMQTRYMELREDRAMRAQANAMVEESVREDKKLRQREKDKHALRDAEQMQMLMRMREPQDKNGDGIWILALLLSMGNNTWLPQQAMHSFNRLAA